MDSEEPDGKPDLCPVTLQDRKTFQLVFANLAQPISDYSFANVFIWNTALKLYWKRIHSHLCIFMNGKDLTLVGPFPEPGATPNDLYDCLNVSFEIMNDYNRTHSDPSHSRVEYISDELLEQVNKVCGSSLVLSATPMSGDYIYPVENMIQLPGGALKSKRQLKTRFLREHPDVTTENLERKHISECMALLDVWYQKANERHEGQITEDESQVSTAFLRTKETNACSLALNSMQELDLKGMVVYSGGQIIGFTLGEQLSPMQASILIEKTHPDYNGCPQFIFSEFCRQYWSDYPEINVGDDWGIPTLRWTKESYKPSRRLSKYMLTQATPLPKNLDNPVFADILVCD